MRTRMALCLLIFFILLLALYIKIVHQESGVSNYIAYLHQQCIRSMTYIYLAMAAGTLLSAGQVDISSGAVLNLFGMIAIYLSNFSEGGYSVAIIALVILTFVLALYGLYSFVLTRWSLLSALILTLGAFFVLRGIGESLQIGMQGVGVLGPLLNPYNISELWVSPIPSERFESSLLSNPLFHAAGLVVTMVAMHLWRYNTRSGLHHVALGESGLAATRVGVNRERVLKIAFLIAGGLVFLGWLNEFFTVRLTSWSMQGANGYELLAIAAAVIGGTRIEGGRFDPISAALGGVFVKLVESLTPLIKGMPSEFAFLLVGGSLIVAASCDRSKQSDIDRKAQASLQQTRS